MSWNPEACGAQCSVCPLREDRIGKPVPPFVPREEQTMMLLVDAPGKFAVSSGKALAGQEERELERAAWFAGVTKESIRVDHVVACMAPGRNGLGGYRLKIRAQNKVLIDDHKKSIKLARASLRVQPWYKGSTVQERLAWLDAVAPKPVLQEDPVDCCRPRVRDAVYETSKGRVVPMGSLPLQELTGNYKVSLEQAQGGWKTVTWEDDGCVSFEFKILPTHALSSIRKNKSLRLLVANHLAKAMRFFENKLDYPDDDTEYIETNPSLSRLYYLLFQQEPRPLAWSADWETNKDHVLLVRPKSINIGYQLPGFNKGKDLMGWRAIVIERVDVRDGTLINEAYWNACMEYFKAALEDGRLWLTQNGGVFDVPVMKFELGVVPANHIDIMYLHGHLYQTQRHNLGFMTTSLTDASAYKVDEDGEGMAGTSDRRSFQVYGGRDGFCTGMNYTVMMQGDENRRVPSVVEKGYFAPMPIGTGQSLAELDDWTQKFSAGLNEIGIWLNEPWRRRLAAWYEGVDVVLRKSIDARAWELGLRPKDWDKADEADALADPDYEPSNMLNPSSVKQMQHLLYDRLVATKVPGRKLEPQDDELSDSGAPGTSAATLRRVILKSEEYGIDPRDRQLLINIYKERKIRTKFLGTYLRPFGPWSDDKNKKAAVRFRKEEEKGRDLHDVPLRHPVWADGRVRGKWRPDSAVHRLKCKGAPFQVLPKTMKPVWQPEPGHAFAGCDMEQMHPRIFAGLTGAPRLLECFATFEDFYSVVAHLCDPVEWERVCPRHGDGRLDFKTKPKVDTHKEAAIARDRWKTHILSSIYDASVMTRLMVMRKVEDSDGNLIGGRLSDKMIEGWDVKMHRGIPELARWWASVIDEAESNGRMTGTDPWLADPFGGRVRYFYNGLQKHIKGNDRSDAINWKVLAGESTIMHTLVQRSEQRFPLYFEGPGTGIFIQVHDQVGIELDIRGLSHCAKSHTKKGKLVTCENADPMDACDTGSISHKCRRYMHELVEIQSGFNWRGVPFPAEGSWGFDLTKA
jgi:uracil-DNA glycosylase